MLSLVLPIKNFVDMVCVWKDGEVVLSDSLQTYPNFSALLI